MKKVVIYLIYFLFILPIYAQGVLVEMTEEEKIDQQLANYINLLNSQLDQTTIKYSYVLKNVNIQDTTATAVCDIIIMGDTVSYLQNENIELVKNYEWRIKTHSLGDWFSDFNVSKSVSQQYNNLRTTSTESFKIKLSENSMISNRLYSNVYEINSTLTMNELNRKLFSDNSEMDGAILYHGTDGSRKTAFITDRKWRRIVYATTTENEIKSFRGSTECPLLIPVAIAVHTNSNTVFVADKGNRQICRFFYSEASNSLTGNSASSNFLDYTKVRRPVDIELSDDEEYLFVCDSETKSIKKFDLNGNLIVEITGDANYTLNSPMFIEPYSCYIVIIDKDINGNYNLVWLLDDDNPYSVPAGTFARKIQFPSGTVPTDLSEAVDNRLLVPDNGNKMIHSFFGGYICSFNGNSTATNSDFSSLGRIPTIYSAPGNYINPHLLIAEDWTAQSGIKYYAEGADILDLEYIGFDNEIKTLRFSMLPTNTLDFSINIIRKSDNTIILSKSGSLYGGGPQNISISYDGVNLVDGNYKMQISYTPKYNSSYSNPVPAITKSLDFYYGGSVVTLNGSHTWSGVTSLTRDVVIAAGATLTILQGAEIKSLNNSSLFVNGTLDIEGTSTNKVKLALKSIKIYSGGTADINYAVISNTQYGIKSESDNVTIFNTKISSCNIGISLFNSSPTIHNCLIQNNLQFGIHANNYSIPTLWRCTIRNNGSAGVYGEYHSRITLSSGYNLITGNSKGIKLSYYAQSYAGYVSGPGLCSIYSNTGYEFEAQLNSNADLRMVYWGSPTGPTTNDFTVDASSSYDYTPYLTSDQGAGSSLSKVSVEVTDFDLANEYYSKGDYESAKKLFKQIIKENERKDIAMFALEGLNHCYIKDKQKGCKDYLQTKLKAKSRSKNDKFELQILELEAYWYLQEGDIESAIHNYDYILKNFTANEEAIKFNLYSKGKAYLNYAGDKEKATEVFNELKSKYPNDMLVELSDEALNNAHQILSSGYLEKEDNAITSEKEEVISDYSLSENYPNPFNPTTTISYQLPEAGFVTLKVFDMLGREVASLVNNKMEAGKYSVNFNASNLASGIYIYRITIQSFEGSKDFFTQSNKMLLLK